MDFLSALEERARAVHGSIALAEGFDARVVEAAGTLVDRQVCRVTIACPAAQRTAAHDDLESRGVQVVDPATDPRRERLAGLLHDRRKHKGMSLDDALGLLVDPLYFTSLLVAAGEADGSIGGAVRTTADTVRAALHAIGAKPGLKTVSSSFVMVHPDPTWGDGGVMVFADCAVLPDPDPIQLAEIAIGAADTFRLIVGGEPRVALLSFSTRGSAEHPAVAKVQAAVAELRRRVAGLRFRRRAAARRGARRPDRGAQGARLAGCRPGQRPRLPRP